jgi:tetratricopeptide (TPR) repeat protein
VQIAKDSIFVPVDANYYLGLIRLKRTSFLDALIFFEEEIKLNKRNSKVYDATGFVKSLMGEFDEAKKDFEKAFKINKKNMIAYTNASVIDCLRGDYSSALETLAVALNVYKTKGRKEYIGDIMSVFDLAAKVNIALNNGEETNKLYNEIIEQPIHSEHDVQRYANALINLGIYKKAMFECDNIINEIGENVLINIMLGDMYRFGAAENKMSVGDSEAHYTRAITLYLDQPTKTLDDYLQVQRAASGLKKINCEQNQDSLKKGVLNIDLLAPEKVDNYLKLYR